MPLTDNAADLEQQQGGMFSGNKKWLWIGGAVLLVIVVLLMKKGGSTSTKGQNASGTGGNAINAGNVDPATGYGFGSGPDIASLRTYGALAGGAKYNAGAAPPRAQGGPIPIWQLGQNGRFLSNPSSMSSVYVNGLPEPSYPIGPSGTPGPGNIGATGVNPSYLLKKSQAYNVMQTVPPQDQHGRVYTVKPGDNLASIAAQFGVPGGENTLYRLNQHTIGLNGNLLIPGTRIIL